MLTRPHMSRPRPQPQGQGHGFQGQGQGRSLQGQGQGRQFVASGQGLTSFTHSAHVTELTKCCATTRYLNSISVPIRNSKQQLACSSVQCRPKLSKAFSRPQFTRPRPWLSRPRPRPQLLRPRPNITGDRCIKGLMWYHGMDVVYPRLSNWTCLQWTLDI